MFKAVATEINTPFDADIEQVFKGSVEITLADFMDEDRFSSEAADCDALLVVYVFAKVTRKIIEGAKKLKVIGRYGVGTDNIDMGAATERGIVVVNCPFYHIPSVPEHVIGLMFALARKIPLCDRSVRSGMWDHQQVIGLDIEGKTLGILGLGRIGSTLAKKAIGLGMRVIGHDPYVSRDQVDVDGLELASVDRVIEESDFVSINMPLTDRTKGLVDGEFLARMKSTAFLINTARGPIVDEESLYCALTSGTIAGAGLDVMANEPPGKEHRLYKLDNVVFTPHSGGSTCESFSRLASSVSQDVLAVLQHRKPEFVCNPEALGKPHD